MLKKISDLDILKEDKKMITYLWIPRTKKEIVYKMGLSEKIIRKKIIEYILRGWIVKKKLGIDYYYSMNKRVLDL